MLTASAMARGQRRRNTRRPHAIASVDDPGSGRRWADRPGVDCPDPVRQRHHLNGPQGQDAQGPGPVAASHGRECTPGGVSRASTLSLTWDVGTDRPRWTTPPRAAGHAASMTTHTTHEPSLLDHTPRLAWYGGWISILVGIMHSLARFATEAGQEDVTTLTSFWADPARRLLEPLLTFADVDHVYVIYGMLWGPLFLVGPWVRGRGAPPPFRGRHGRRGAVGLAGVPHRLHPVHPGRVRRLLRSRGSTPRWSTGPSWRW